ncbi:MAG: hypothetical protein GY950_24710, partial [bacterium]|nr:hypothetical protein [bacterium]
MRKQILLISLSIGFLLVSWMVYGAVPAGERAALIALYNTANGDNWINNSGWKDGTLENDGFGPIGSEGDWFGITVSENHVTEIWLPENGLTGNITPQLEALNYLVNLYLSTNELTGGIPSQLGNLSRLEFLSLGSNSLSGEIPPELGNLSSLKYLKIGRTDLTGSIPVELGNLDNLLELGLGFNRLSGAIPPELGNLSNLSRLILSGNELSGTIPPELGNLSNLHELFLSENQLTGSIPPELGNLSNLYKLSLLGNRLSGNIPPEIGNLSNLITLFLYSNQLIGEIPTTITNLVNLELDYSHFHITANGLYTHNPTVRAFMDRTSPNWWYIQTIAPSDLSAVMNSASSIRVSWEPIYYKSEDGGYMVYYGTSAGGPWTYAGITADKSADSFNVTGLRSGVLYYFMVKTRTDAYSGNDNTVISEQSEVVYNAIGFTGPFGSFDTPVDGSVLSGSIPVTGWALDDFETAGVKIYREAEEWGTLTYIGDAIFVEGARPDVETAYPAYTNNSKAGWGYMLLTHFLPNGGNGPYTIHAVAVDIEGNEVTLGTKTFICDNANAVKPFGAIDTPDAGEIASGRYFVNRGWVLTPLPNSIPQDGSTIAVYVDGVFLGHPRYNLYRSDIDRLFPGYANAGGAGADFVLDTTGYADGVHTIYWTAEDDAGNADGIGSRYFT